MEEQRRIFQTFLAINGKKASHTDRPVAHMQFHSDTLDPNAPLLLMDQEDILRELDKESSHVRWLLNQLTTYDCTRQKIIGLIFDSKTVVSDVLWSRREIDRTD